MTIPTPEQLDMLAQSFNQIPPAENFRIITGIFKAALTCPNIRNLLIGLYNQSPENATPQSFALGFALGYLHHEQVSRRERMEIVQ